MLLKPVETQRLALTDLCVGQTLQFHTLFRPITVGAVQPIIAIHKLTNSFCFLADIQRQIIASAMNEYHKNTCIRFVPRTNERDYIEIRSQPEPALTGYLFVYKH